MARKERALTRPREKAQVLRVGPARDRHPRALGELADLRLVQLAERESHPRERVRSRARTARSSGPWRHPRPSAAAGRPRLARSARSRGPRPEPVGELEHRVQPHAAVASHARVRRQTRGVVGEPTFHHARAELLAQVDREVRHPEPVSEIARAADRLRGAAAEVAVVLGIRPQLECHADGVRARPRATSSAAIALSTPPLIATSVRDALADSAACVLRRRSERTVQRIGGQLRRVALRRRQPAELVGDVARADAGGLKQWNAAHERRSPRCPRRSSRRIRPRRSRRRRSAPPRRPRRGSRS